MELKQPFLTQEGFQTLLLIVPYGIETRDNTRPLPACRTFNRTLWNWNEAEKRDNKCRWKSFNRTLWNWNDKAVIGETLELSSFNRTLWNWNDINQSLVTWLHFSFNRTLWNWNTLIWLLYALNQFLLLIVPYGIETKDGSQCTGRNFSFNRTLWNWNKKTNC